LCPSLHTYFLRTPYSSYSFLSLSIIPRPPTSTLFPYTTLFRSFIFQNKGSLSNVQSAAVSGAVNFYVGLIKKGLAETQDKLSSRSEEHTSELQSLRHLVCRLLLEKKKKKEKNHNNQKEK